MRIHHGYVGVILIFWSLLTIFFRIGVIGSFRFDIALAGLILGAILLVHDAWWHLTHRKH